MVITLTLEEFLPTKIFDAPTPYELCTVNLPIAGVPSRSEVPTPKLQSIIDCPPGGVIA